MSYELIYIDSKTKKINKIITNRQIIDDYKTIKKIVIAGDIFGRW